MKACVVSTSNLRLQDQTARSSGGHRGGSPTTKMQSGCVWSNAIVLSSGHCLRTACRYMTCGIASRLTGHRMKLYSNVMAEPQRGMWTSQRMQCQCIFAGLDFSLLGTVISCLLEKVMKPCKSITPKRVFTFELLHNVAYRQSMFCAGCWVLPLLRTDLLRRRLRTGVLPRQMCMTSCSTTSESSCRHCVSKSIGSVVGMVPTATHHECTRTSLQFCDCTS